MMAPAIRATLVLALLASSVVSAPARAASGDGCRARTLDRRPPFRTVGFDTGPFQKRHNRFLRTHRPTFASGYASGKHFWIGFTAHVCRNLRAFRKGLDQAWRARTFIANYSYSKLRRIQRCISELMYDHRYSIRGTDVDVHRNKAEAILKHNTAWRRRAIRRECGPAGIYFEEGNPGPN